jgi:predicted small metal-binding protein
MSQRVECIVDGCSGVCTGETEDELMAEVTAHVEDAHPELLPLDDETVEAVKAEVETV